MEYSPDSKLIVAGGVYQSPSVWNVDTGKLQTRIEKMWRAAWYGAFAPNGKTLVLWGGDSTIHLWDLESNKEIPVGDGHGYHVRSLSLSPDSKTAATASSDGIFLWDLATGKKKHHLQAANQEGFWCVAFAPDGNTLATGGHEIRLWNATTGRETLQWKTGEASVFNLAYSPQDDTLYSTGYFLVEAWDPKTGKAKRQFGKIPPREEIWPDRVTPLFDLGISRDGKTIFADDRFWNTETGNVILKNEMKGSTRPFVFSPDSKSVASLKSGIRQSAESLVLWDLTTGKAQRTYQKEGFFISSFAQSPKGKYFAVVGEDGSLRLWEAASGKELQVFTGGAGTLVAFTPNGRYVVCSSGGTDLIVWDVSRWIRE